MVLSPKIVRIVSIILGVKALIFFVLAAVNLLAIPSFIMAGLAGTWLLAAVVLAYAAHRIEKRIPDLEKQRVMLKFKRRKEDEEDEEEGTDSQVDRTAPASM